jgi:hypothetical protein
MQQTDFRQRNDKRHRARVERALRARPEIAVSNSEFVELLHSADPERLLLRIAKDRRAAKTMSGDPVEARNFAQRRNTPA